MQELIEKMMTRVKISPQMKKIFTVQTPSNRQNDRVYSKANVKRDITPARLIRGGATILKMMGTKCDLRAKKNFVLPTFGKWGVQNFFSTGGTNKQIIISIEYTEICCLVVTLISVSQTDRQTCL